MSNIVKTKEGLIEKSIGCPYMLLSKFKCMIIFFVLVGIVAIAIFFECISIIVVSKTEFSRVSFIENISIFNTSNNVNVQTVLFNRPSQPIGNGLRKIIKFYSHRLGDFSAIKNVIICRIKRIIGQEQFGETIYSISRCSSDISYFYRNVYFDKRLRQTPAIVTIGWPNCGNIGAVGNFHRIFRNSALLASQKDSPNGRDNQSYILV